MKNRFTKILSIILSVIMIFSVCSVAAVATEAVQKEYYVINGGTGDGKTADTPAATVNDAIATALADGLVVGDTAIVYIMQKAWKSTAELTYWADSTIGTKINNHEFTLEVKPYDNSDTTYLLYHNKANYNEFMVLGGPTVFDDITIVCCRNNYDPISLLGNSVTFRDGVKYGTIGTSFGAAVTNKDSLMIGLGYYQIKHTVEKEFNMVFENAFVSSDSDYKNTCIIIGAHGPEKATYNEDVNITFNNPDISALLSWGNKSEYGGDITFKKNVNIYAPSANTITNTQVVEGSIVNVEGAIQFIYDSSTTFSGDVAALSGVTAAGGTYTIKNKSSQDDLLTFTDTAGVYNVKEGFTAYAVDAVGEVYASENGVLTVPAGVYTVTDVEPSGDPSVPVVTVKDYYVINGGTGDGKTAETPAASVNDAITTAREDGLEKGDIANIYIMQKNWSNTGELTYWADSSVGTSIKKHEFTIEVKPYDAETTTYLLFHNKASYNEYLVLGGPTVFDDITIVCNRQNWDSISLLGNNATFRDGVKYGTIGGSFGTSIKNCSSLMTTTGYYSVKHTVAEEYNLVFENAFVTSSDDVKNSSIVLGAQGPESQTFNEDVNILFNNPEIDATILWGCMHSSGTTTLNKNLNVKINSAVAVTNSSWSESAVNVIGGAQFIVNAPAVLKGDLGTLDGVSISGGIFVLNNKTGVEDVIDFTGTAGTYAVKEGYDVKAVNANGDEFTSSNGYLSVPSGEYTVETYIPPVTYNYYVKNGGTGDGKTAETPAPTVYAAIETINADGLKAGDTANIYIMQREDWNGTADAVAFNMTSWATLANIVPPAHEAQIVVQAYDLTTTTYLAPYEKLGGNEFFYTSGPTTFKNITLVGLRSDYDGIALCGHDVIFGAGTKYGRIANYGDWDGTVASPFPGLNTSLSQGFVKETYGGQTVVFENEYSGADKNRGLYINGKGACKATYTDDVNLIFNNSKIDLAVYWGNGNVNGPTYFEKNFNIMVKNAKNITNNVGSATVDVAGALQIIVNSATGWVGDVDTFENVTKGAYWFITNNSGLGDILGFTATAGTYNVREGYTAVATNDATGEKVTSADNSITLAEGKWTVTAIKNPEVKNYYVINGGTGDGRSLTAPAPTVYDVIKSINADGLIAGDTANVYIMQRPDWNKSAGVLVGKTAATPAPKHEMTAWAPNGSTPDSHSAQLVVQAYNAGVDTYLTFTDKLGANEFMVLAGPTVFKNIRIVSCRNYYASIELAGNSVTFGEGTVYGKIDNDEYAGTASAWNGKVTSYDALNVATGTYSVKTTVNKEVNVVFENEYTTLNKNTSVYMDTTGISTNVYNEDYNFILNNKEAAPTIYLGNTGTAGSSTFNKNLNFIIRNGNGLSIAEGKNPVTVKGALQVVANSGAVFTGDLANFSNLTVDGGIWIVRVNTVIADALALTDTVGKYTVADGRIAVAKDASGNIILSENGVLTLAAGEYTVDIVDDYVNDGEKITVYSDCVIDLEGIEYTYKEGKLFMGWVDEDGEYLPRKAKYFAGDVLTAAYIDFDKSDFAINDTHIRTEGDLGIRFVVNQNKEALALLPEIVESGAIVLPTDLAGGRDIYLDTPVVISWKWDDADKNNFTPDKTGYTPSSLVFDKVLEETVTDIKYSLCVTGIEEDKYNTFYTARGYIIYLDYNDIEHVVYTDDAQNSLYKLAAEAVAAGDKTAVYADIVDYVENVWNVNYVNDLYSEVTYWSGFESTADKDPNHKIYSLKNGLYIREHNVSTGFNVEPVEIGFLSDGHFNYINEIDILTKNTNALSSYRGRSWSRDGSSVEKVANIMKYATTLDKVVLGGDFIDHFGHGTLSVYENNMTRKSVNGKIIMTPGNHELEEIMQTDISGLENVYTLAERQQMLQEIWANDLNYYEEIMKKADGSPNVMLVLIDGSQEHYWENQIPKLKASIAKARELNIPMFLFSHVPMLTMNPNETEVLYSKHVAYFGEYAPEGTEGEIKDLTNYHGFMGNPKHSEALVTIEVCDIIRQSSDVIKGVINGHHHTNMYSEIVAIDENGNTLYDENGEMVIIPQFTSYYAYGNSMIKLVVE